MAGQTAMTSRIASRTSSRANHGSLAFMGAIDDLAGLAAAKAIAAGTPRNATTGLSF